MPPKAQVLSTSVREILKLCKTRKYIPADTYCTNNDLQFTTAPPVTYTYIGGSGKD